MGPVPSSRVTMVTWHVVVLHGGSRGGLLIGREQHGALRIVLLCGCREEEGGVSLSASLVANHELNFYFHFETNSSGMRSAQLPGKRNLTQPPPPPQQPCPTLPGSWMRFFKSLQRP
ncbi:unnamed protein product [Pleuronectes platessa]|uniref:Uncharacterized protein n=1 Tax=Pleuronectes platessa TaxID=8262 RepID=A0A9N7YQ31_PLEPL|nr:unnamed protein product [Pleuronectes platessa]